MRYYTCARKTKFNAHADEEFVFDVGVTAAGLLVASGSDRSLRVFDAATLVPIAAIPDVHTKISGLRVKGSEAYTSGEDGSVKMLDVRSGGIVSLVHGAQNPPWLCLDVDGPTVAAGSELKGSDAVLALWDTRQSGQRVFSECHTEDVTQVALQSSPLRVLSGGQDGLMTLLDPSLGEEEDCVLQVFNLTSSLAHCGFLNERYVYGISHMETMGVYNTDAEEEGSTPFHDLGDLRSSLGCDYVAGFIASSTGHAVITGSFSEPVAHVLEFDVDTMQMDRTRGVQLIGAHQSELLRCGVLLDDQLIITGGEDNEIRAWRHDETIQGSKGSNSARIRRKSKGLEEAARFQPY